MRELYKNHPNALWHQSDKESLVPQRILKVFLLNSFFAIVELIGGILTGSVAIIADAIHDFGDSLSLGVAYYCERVARKRDKDNIFSYGYGRLSLLSAVVSGIVLLIGMAYVLTESLHRFFDGQTEPYAPGMFGLAILGIAVNGIAAKYLSHGHTQNEKVLTWHLVEDVLGWVAVLIGALVIMFFGWNWVDPVLAVGISIYVSYNAIKNLRDSLKLMLQSVPEEFDGEKFLGDVSEIKGVDRAHDLHVWSLDGQKHILSLHILLEDGVENFQEITDKAREIIAEYGEFHATIELENYGVREIEV